MADVDRMVRVSGLPTNIEDDRLSDKLLILFLREKNGGGEIVSVTIDKDPPGSALITFEDGRVARRVIRHGHHVLEFDGTQYELTLTPHYERLEPDMVVLSMSVTIDCKKVPLRRSTRKILLENNPDIKFKDIASEKTCEVTGPYSQVQTALEHLLRLPRHQKSEDKSSTDDRASSGGPDINAIQRSPPPETQLPKPYNSSVYTEQSYQQHHAGDHRSTDPPRGQPKSGSVWEDMDRTEAGPMQLSNDPQMLDEDLTLVMDADMFQYLQKHCGTEYQRILGQNGVEVLDVTSEGVTTLMLHCERNLGEADNCLQRLRSARNQISQLYQDEEMTICRVHLLKSSLPPAEVLRRITEELAATHPRLLLNEDDQNIYLIGSYNDTTEAKKVLWGYNEPRAVPGHIFGGLPRSHSLDLSSAHPPEDPPVVHRPRPDSPRAKVDTLRGPDRVECRAEGTAKYKLAAQFPFSEPGAFGSLPADLTGAGSRPPPPAMRTALGPLFGSDALSGTARLTERSLPRQSTGGEDVLFESGARPSQSSASGDYGRTFPESPPFPTQIGRSGSVPRPALGTGLSSNFDRPLDDREHRRRANRVRANSWSYQKEKDRSDNVQITVPYMIWKYIKEVYQPQFVDVTRAIKVEELHTDSMDSTTVVLTALDRSRVETCQTDLQNIVSKVTADFSQRLMLLTELGVSDPSDETLQEFIAEVQRRFKKVSIQTSEGIISILGPEHLCSQVATALTEWLSSRSAQIPGQQKLSSSEASTLSSSSIEAISTYIRKDQHLSFFDSDSCQRSTTSQTNTTIDSSANPLDDSGQQAIDSRQNMSTLQTEYNRLSLLQNDNRSYGSTKSQPYAEASSPCSTSGRSGPQSVKDRCYYCSSVESLTTEECGRTMCPECQVKLHARCRTCPKGTQCKGIQGSIRFSDLSLTLQGHSKEATTKITYTIPDGIQGEGHPYPGLPFKGGVFVAYLPGSEKARRLLPRLEEAFKRGLTFTIQRKQEVDSVIWDCIPHKTSIQGGKSKNGYPDVTFLTRLADILTSNGV